MKKISLLWHLHQPSYIKENKLFLPWVFLHSIKDYYDMAYLAQKFDVKVTFNMTPILIEQILMYDNIEVDYFLQLISKNIKDLKKKEKKFILKILKSCNYETMVKPLKYFDLLYTKNNYSDEEFLDLEVWFLLSWSGNYLKEHNNFIKYLLSKQSFNEDEKIKLLKELIEFVKTIIPYYKQLFLEHKIEITTTPFYHPIIPLLIDANIAKQANKEVNLPKGILSLKDDAVLHIQKSIKYFEAIFDKKPIAFWPSEGAIDEESIKIYKSLGIKWIASDEEVLKNSGYKDNTKVYQYEGVSIYFRNHSLSDLIGFDYKLYSPIQAVDDFKDRLKDFNVIILDGENAWEYYPNNAKEFLEQFYFKLKDNFVFFEETAEINLENIKAGSWIYGNFDTWIGDEEKNRAWELLFDTKRDYLRLNKENKQAIEEFLKAECSDWFWWYGEGNFTEYAKEFDMLFREHLKNVYKIIDIPYPEVLDIEIIGNKGLKNIISEPKEYIYPIIDGKVTSFFEWIDAGVLYEAGNSMKANEVIKYIYWGENEESFFIRLDGKNVAEYEYKVFFDDKQLNKEEKKQQIVEMKIDKTEFIKNSGILRIEVLKDDKIIQILPSNTRLFIKIDVELNNWFI